MKVGDLVRIKTKDVYLAGKIGVVVDVVENTDGFSTFEILVDGEHMWFHDLELEVLDAV